MADQMKITELGVDCLEHIFKKLEFIDLLNVANASKHFKHAVDLAYAQKYGKMTIAVQIYKQDQLYKVESDRITVYDSLVSLRLLRCFGHLIRDLRIYYQAKHQPHLDVYINEYCANSLTEIELYCPVKEALGNFTKPFSKCEKVYLIVIHLDTKLTDFNRWFPKMRSLCLETLETKILSYLDKHFPNLEDVRFGDMMMGTRTLEQNVFNFLRWNPQLRCLDVESKLSGAFLQSTSEHFQRIETLSISCDGLSGYTDGIIHFERVKELTLRSYNIDPVFPLSFPQLQILTIDVEFFLCGSNIWEFIHQHRSTLVKVTVNEEEYEEENMEVDEEDNEYYEWGKYEDFNKKDAALAMELLIDIDLTNIVLSTNEAIHFLNICKQLKSFRFKLYKKDNVANFNDSLKCIGGGWNLSTEDNGRILLKR